MYAQTAIVALFASIAAAVHTPTTQWATDNPITAPLNEVVTAGKPFTIKWTPTTSNPISIVFLKGPSNNVVPVGSPLADGIPNSGSFVWTPSSEFGTSDGPTGFGLEIIDSVTGQYQYSTQFGLKAGASSAAASSTPAATSSAGGYKASTPAVSSSVQIASTSAVVVKSTPAANATGPCTTTTTVYIPPTATGVASGYPGGNQTVIQPSKPLTVPSSLMTATGTGSPTKPTAPMQSFNAGAHVKVSVGAILGAAGVFFML